MGGAVTKEGENPPRNGFLKWIRRLVIALAVAFLLLVAFHRPLLRSLLSTAGPWAAETQGIKTFTWSVAGSVLGDIELDDVNAGGGEGHWLPTARIGRLQLDYDLWRLLQEGPEHALSKVVIHDVDLELDLRRLPASKPAPPEPPSDTPATIPPIPWPDTFDLHNITAHVTLPDGHQIILKNFSFRAGEGTPGVIALQQFSQEPDGVNSPRNPMASRFWPAVARSSGHATASASADWICPTVFDFMSSSPT
jgi:hypothetical protein